MIIRSKGVKAEALANIYKTLSQVIKDESCFYTKEELKELKNKEYILIGGVSMAKSYNFGEKKTEYNAKLGKEVEVWQSPKYLEAKKKAIETLESPQYKDVLSEGDFWILMNATKSGKMAYTGLIISHNGCLKINDVLPADKRFKPSCVQLDKDGYNGSLVYSYSNDDQGIYEVGEVSAKNCTNAYPYAMALKRCIDRVILKSSKLAYSGIYSDSEAEEFKNDPDETKEVKAETPKEEPKSTTTAKPKAKAPETKTASSAPTSIRQALVEFCNVNAIDLLKICKEYHINNNSPDEDFKKALDYCHYLKESGNISGYLKLEEV